MQNIKLSLAIITGLCVLGLFSLYSLSLGRFHTSFLELLIFFKQSFFGGDLAQEKIKLLKALVLETRAPRVLAAVVIGAGLSISGALLQGVFKNPLVSPAILGVLNGAAFGASLGLILHLSYTVLPLLACIFGMVAVFLGLFIARRIGGGSILLLILGGLISNAVFAGALSLVKYLADPQDELPSIVFWLLGGLGSIRLDFLYLVAPILCVIVLTSCFLGRLLDVLCLGDDEAMSLGLDAAKLRFLLIIVASFACALCVCLAGVIGWIGLLIPHLMRLCFGASNRYILPLCAIYGGLFLLFCDDLARSLSANEIPLGVITQLLGALCFFLLLLRGFR